MRLPYHHATLRLVVDNSSSSVRVPPRLRAAARSLRCHEPGMARRVLHLVTCQSVAPSDIATAVIDGQRSAEKMSIAPSMDKMSGLSRTTVRLNRRLSGRRSGMSAKSSAPRSRSEYRTKMRARMKDARDRVQKSQADI